MAATTNSSTRRFELDWLRVLAIGLVFLFHSSRFFDPTSWHVKNATTYPLLQVIAMLVIVWMMPLLFAISGASTFYALRNRRGGAFLKDRALRLLVPLVVGAFTHVMWQVYLERTTYHQFSGSFLQFIPHYFDGWYAFGGNFAWMGLHLWYLELLFAYSLVFLPLFLWLKQGAGRAALTWLGDRLAATDAVYLLAIPIMALVALPTPNTFLGARNFGGWSLLGYIPIFLNGYLLVSHDRLYDQVRRLRWVSLAAAVGLTIGLLAWYMTAGEPRFGTTRYTALFALYGLCAWCWVLAILGLAAQHLRFGTPFLAVANEGVLPFYILHQTVLLTVGYVVVRWAMPDLAKWAVIAVSSLAICLGLYWFVIRPVNLLRFLFGMKPRASRLAQQ
jgi:peptidoglycan/LPS O-acetylase OafA/YrhL